MTVASQGQSCPAFEYAGFKSSHPVYKLGPAQCGVYTLAGWPSSMDVARLGKENVAHGDSAVVGSKPG